MAIPQIVSSTLKAGTGLGFDLKDALTRIYGLPEARRTQKLRSAQQALTCLGNSGPLHADWMQKPLGRIYATNPALQMLPKVFRSSLRSLQGGHIACVDFNSFEFRIACSMTGEIAPKTDCAQYIGDAVQLERAAVKAVINPMLHGRTVGNLIGVGNKQGLKDRLLVESFLRKEWPSLLAGVGRLRQQDPDFLQRRGAQIYFQAYAETLYREVIPAGIPMHDGWIFAATDQKQALRVKIIFEEVASTLLGQEVMVTHEMLS